MAAWQKAGHLYKPFIYNILSQIGIIIFSEKFRCGFYLGFCVKMQISNQII